MNYIVPLPKKIYRYHANHQSHRFAASPSLSQLDSRSLAVTITLGLNDEYLLQGCTSIFLKMLRGGSAPSGYRPSNDQPIEQGALHAHLDLPLTIADLMRSARQESSRFPTTRTAPRFAPATSAQRTTELRQDVTSALLADVFAQKKEKDTCRCRIADFDS